MTAASARKLYHMPVELSTDMAAAQLAVHTQVVDVERGDRLEYVAVGMMLKHAEGVAHGHVAVVHRHKHWTAVVCQYVREFLVCIFPPEPEQVRTSFVVHGVHLTEQIVYLWYVLTGRSAYVHAFIILCLQDAACLVAKIR